MTMQQYGPDRDPAEDSTRGVTPQAHPTEELPTYRKVAGYPAPEPTRPITPQPAGLTEGTGQLPVTGAPVTSPRRPSGRAGRTCRASYAAW
ncbi:hypothetical protein [Flexivirga alba]|uniref:Uncharacterized protein n=1 Tax=Flexivirga alba TaxID=702742 RepID=A0ABW2AN89_9MICO